MGRHRASDHTVRALRRVTQVLGELLISAGVLLLVFLAWQLWWTDVVAVRVQAQATERLERSFGHPPKGVTIAPVTSVPAGKDFAIIRIPRFGHDFARPVLQGTEYSVLEQGFGHYDGTALPGQVGNFAVAGHRTTYGKPLNQIATLQAKDVIVVETRASYFVYTVQRHVIVAPTDVDVVAAVPQQPEQVPTTAYLTLTSCHPEFSAQQRYVVFATLQKSIPRADGLAASYLAAPAAASKNGG